MTPLDKEVAEWMEGLGFILHRHSSGRIEYVLPADLGLMAVKHDQATFFYAANLRSQLDVLNKCYTQPAFDTPADSTQGKMQDIALNVQQEIARLEAQLNNSDKENE